jgi:signal transduction histidine kinase
VTSSALRFLVVAPVGRDAELISGLLNTSGYASGCMETIRDVEAAESSDILGLVLTDEAFANEGFEALRSLIDAQPEWSDLPVILLTSGPREPRQAIMANRVRVEFRSVFLLDRPVRKELLLSAIQVAYNSRLKQLEVRDAAARQFQSDETLRNAEKLATAGRLAATMAHEVNNPLEALGNLLFLIENSSAVEEARSFGRLAAQELQRISDIVNQTLRFHRAPAKPGYTDVAELATSALALFRGKLRERNIMEYVSAEPTFAFCSAGEIRQAVVNLIGNALDAMAQGGKLYLRVSSVSLNGVPCARLSIADTGSGIRKEIRPSLFTQFFTTKGSRGTGLGLWLTRDIVLRNSGRLRFRSRTGAPSGTVFTIYLPCRALTAVGQPGTVFPRDEPANIEAA